MGDDYPTEVQRRLTAGGFAFVIEAVGSREALRHCRHLAGERGQVRAYGLAPVSSPWDPADLEDPRVQRQGAKEDQVHDEMLALVAAGRVQPDGLGQRNSAGGCLRASLRDGSLQAGGEGCPDLLTPGPQASEVLQHPRTQCLAGNPCEVGSWGRMADAALACKLLGDAEVYVPPVGAIGSALLAGWHSPAAVRVWEG